MTKEIKKLETQGKIAFLALFVLPSIWGLFLIGALVGYWTGLNPYIAVAAAMGIWVILVSKAIDYFNHEIHTLVRRIKNGDYSSQEGLDSEDHPNGDPPVTG